MSIEVKIAQQKSDIQLKPQPKPEPTPTPNPGEDTFVEPLGGHEDGD